MFWLLMAALAVGGYLWRKRGSRNKIELEKLQAHAKEWAEIDARFPVDRFPRIEAKFYHFVAKYDDFRGPVSKEIPPDFRDEDKEAWDSIIRRWPSAPQTADESQNNEATFWRNELALHAVKTDSVLQLVPQQKITDYYFAYGRWILREYFAATGTFHESRYNRDFFRGFMHMKESPYAKQFYAGPGLIKIMIFGRRLGRAYWEGPEAKSREARATWIRYAEQHDKEWSSWYVGNVQKALVDYTTKIKSTEQPLVPAFNHARESGQMV